MQAIIVVIILCISTLFMAYTIGFLGLLCHCLFIFLDDVPNWIWTTSLLAFAIAVVRIPVDNIADV